jgi:endoglucanase
MNKNAYLMSIGVLIFLSLNQLCFSQGFLRCSGKKIVNGGGTEIIFNGINFGNSMVMEGYMMNTSSSAGTQHEIKSKLKALIGDSLTTVFYKSWLNNHVTKADIDSIKKWGMNAVRIPIHYEYFTDLNADVWHDWGFTFLDSIVKWCTADSIYAIIDLHAAPGGQGKNAAISDYDPSKSSLWESTANQDKCVALWTKIAQRYVNERFVGGYDLINETNWTMTNNAPLRSLYNRLVTEIRKVDTNHIIFIEGNDYANNYSGLTPPWDNNMAYSFHKYWNPNKQSDIQWILDLRNNYNVPIWCGESGENSNTYLTQQKDLLDANGIGVTWWPMKKFESQVCMAKGKWPVNYNKILNYFSNASNKPSVSEAFSILMQLAENINIKNCSTNTDYVYALLTQPGNKATRPFANNRIPGTISMTNYDLGLQGYSYSDVVFENSTGTSNTPYNSGDKYRNDGVDIQTCTDTYSNGYNIGWTDNKEWTKYTVSIDQTGVYDVVFRTATPNNGSLFHIESKNTDISGTVTVNSSGDWTTWKSDTVKNIALTEGFDTLMFFVDKSGFNINSMIWIGPKANDSVPFSMLSAKTTNDGRTLVVTFNKNLSAGLSIPLSSFTVNSGATIISLSSVTLNSVNPKQLVITANDDIMFDKSYTLSYSGNSIVDTSKVILPMFSNKQIVNQLSARIYIPAKIEAENFSINEGLVAEPCTDTNTGQNLGYTTASDYTEYLVYVTENTNFLANFRYAGNGGKAELSEFVDNTRTVLCSTTFSSTGGWQVWNTSNGNKSFPLSKGYHTLRFTVVNEGFNFNYFNIVKEPTSIPVLNGIEKLLVYPNPSESFINIDMLQNGNFDYEVQDISGKIVLRKNDFGKNSINIKELKSGVYFVLLRTNNKVYQSKFIRK